MPVIKKSLHSNHPNHTMLVDELCRHLGNDPNLPAMPRIVEADDRISKNMHVYVLWDAWDSVSERERSEIILESYEKSRGTQEMLRISVAMGVTPLDAQRLGLEL
jgi:hypothetical protein